MDPWSLVLGIVAMAVVTVGLRAAPFVAAGLLRGRPQVEALGRFAPPMIMCLLLLHSLTDAAQGEAGIPWRAGVAAAVAVLCQLVWRRPLLSIAAGAGLYVLLINRIIV